MAQAPTPPAKPRRARPPASRTRRFSAGLWKFLNSAFFLFLLSTVAVTWATRLYTDYQARQELRASRRAESVRILSEISLRSIRLSSLEYKRRALAESLLRDGRPARIEQVRRERSDYLLAAGAIIRGTGAQGNAASDFAGSHLAALIRQNDLLNGVDSGSLASMASWVESERFSLGLVTEDLEQYVAMQEVGLRSELLPLLPGDDAARAEFDEVVRRRGRAVSAQMRAVFKAAHDLAEQDADVEEAVAVREVGDALDAAVNSTIRSGNNTDAPRR